MISYTKYITATGVIVGSGVTNSQLSDVPLENNQSIIEGVFDVEKYKIIDGEAVEQTIDFWIAVRIERNNLLSESDWTQMSDSPLSDSKKTEWATYRQSLRDLPTSNASASSYDDITFQVSQVNGFSSNNNTRSRFSNSCCHWFRLVYI